MVYLTFPETAYIRKPEPLTREDANGADGSRSSIKAGAEHAEVGRLARRTPKVSEFLWSGLKLYNGTFTEESLWKMIFRPVMLLALPNVLWATLVMSVTIGFIVAITSNVAPAFATTYGFTAWQSGLAFFSAIIGAFIGMFLGGSFSDWVADIFTRRNGGIPSTSYHAQRSLRTIGTRPLWCWYRAQNALDCTNYWHWPE